MNYSHWTIEPYEHRGEKRLLLKFPFKAEDNMAARSLTGSRWSSTLRCWHVQDNDYFRQLFGIELVNKTLAYISNAKNITEEQQAELRKYALWLRNMRYSKSTIETYVGAVKLLMEHVGKSGSEITNDDILIFNDEHILKQNKSASYQSQFINAVKLFLQTIHKSKIIEHELVRPKRGRQLPKVLSEEEIALILNSCDNLKHKAMLSLIYSAGLRRSELLHMLQTDIQSDRMLITVRNAKGMKDRVVPLSPAILEMLREYYKQYRPVVYLFEGMYGGQYSERSLELVLKKAIEKAGIKKKVTLHMLRHSYATHLMEAGTNLRVIQEILGHKSPKTTQIYTHVSKDELNKVVSPFDRLNLKNNENKPKP
jgi:integrase/recombinase XerD